jgi:hypothetical protein
MRAPAPRAKALRPESPPAMTATRPPARPHGTHTRLRGEKDAHVAQYLLNLVGKIEG